MGKQLVVTNGCFDILHLGHVAYLDAAKNLGDVLLVGINGDRSVTALKGEGRPVDPEFDRARVVAALESVDYVFVFQETDAIAFLGRVHPDIYVKGGDYTLKTINQEERNLIESLGGRIEIVTGISGKSTSNVISKLK